MPLPYPHSLFGNAPTLRLRSGQAYKGEEKRVVPHSVPLLCKEGQGEVEPQSPNKYFTVNMTEN